MLFTAKCDEPIKCSTERSRCLRLLLILQIILPLTRKGQNHLKRFCDFARPSASADHHTGVPGARGTFSCLPKRKYPKENGTPRLGPTGFPPGRGAADGHGSTRPPVAANLGATSLLRRPCGTPAARQGRRGLDEPDNAVPKTIGLVPLEAGHAPLARFASRARSHRASGGCGSEPRSRKPLCGCPVIGMAMTNGSYPTSSELALPGPLRLASAPLGCRVGATGTWRRGSARQDVVLNRPVRKPAATREARRAKASGCPCLWVLSIGQAIESASGVGNAVETEPTNSTNARNLSTSHKICPAPTAHPVNP